MNPEDLEQMYLETTSKVKKYQKFGKYLGFLLKTKSYLELEDESKKLTAQHDECELRKRQMQSFNSISNIQLLTIKSYFLHLDQLVDISKEIKDLFRAKESLQRENNETVYDLAIKEVLSNEEYNELVSQAYDFINKIYTNDPDTMKYAYDLVKGYYPINFTRRFLYDLIINNVRNYNKENNDEMKLTLK